MRSDATRAGAQAGHKELLNGRRPRVLVVEPDPICPLDRFAGWLIDAGLALRVIRPYSGEAVPERLTDDGLIVLGGAMSALDDNEHPWLAGIRRLMHRAVRLSRPTLGVCLGGQLLAQTFGGRVTVGESGYEAGIVPIRWRTEAQSDALFANLPMPFLTAASHGDVVSVLPSDAVWLGYSDQYPNQAFRIGSSAWGVQFHPEASLAGYRAWVSGYRGTNPEPLKRLNAGIPSFESLEDEVANTTRALAERFADLVTTRAHLGKRPKPSSR